MAKQNHCVGNLMSRLILYSCIIALVKFFIFYSVVGAFDLYWYNTCSVAVAQW